MNYVLSYQEYKDNKLTGYIYKTFKKELQVFNELKELITIVQIYVYKNNELYNVIFFEKLTGKIISNKQIENVN